MTININIYIYLATAKSEAPIDKLRTVPTIVTAHIFCAYLGSRARRERNAQLAGHADWFCLL